MTDTAELIERLRAITVARFVDHRVREEAASRLASLQEEVERRLQQNEILAEQLASAQDENARLREALKPFAEIATDWDGGSGDPDCDTEAIPVLVRIGHLRRARSALSPVSEGEG